MAWHVTPGLGPPNGSVQLRRDSAAGQGRAAVRVAACRDPTFRSDGLTMESATVCGAPSMLTLRKQALIRCSASSYDFMICCSWLHNRHDELTIIFTTYRFFIVCTNSQITSYLVPTNRLMVQGK